jgi:hypothetical protein
MWNKMEANIIITSHTSVKSNMREFVSTTQYPPLRMLLEDNTG